MWAISPAFLGNTFSITLDFRGTGNIYNFNLYNRLISAGWNDSSPVFVDIKHDGWWCPAEGHPTGATAMILYRFGGWPTGSRVNWHQSGGGVLGGGGAGGKGGSSTTYGGGSSIYAAQPGSQGGTGIFINIDTYLINDGDIHGGAGGGGGGAGYSYATGADSTYEDYGGGGGGGGQDVFSINGGGGGPGTKASYYGQPGGAGSLSAAGVGGDDGGPSNRRSAAGGAGGSWGVQRYGDPGKRRNSAANSGQPGAGGAAGWAVWGWSYVKSYTGSGTLNGPTGG